ncbi:CHAP domain-containing protein [Actinokineospora sp.]|uniref:CHAP domain-containing protein n=1 Tax=Actinokineospora sp. TaxID=1872133 RepID=UPI0040384194
MDTQKIARMFAADMIEHRNRLAGKAEDAHRAQRSLESASTKILEHHTEHRGSAEAARGEWTGRSAEGFERRAKRVTASLEATGTAAGKGATIVASTAQALDGGHGAVVRLIDEYTGTASKVLDAGLAVRGAGQRAALIQAVGFVAELVRHHTRESAKQVVSVRAQMTEAAKQLRALERAVEHDGFADPKAVRKPTPDKKKSPDPKPDRPSTTRPSSSKVKEITHAASAQIGYHEGPGNANKFGPKAAWCSSFATWVWRKAGVNIPILPFTGDVYRWGQRNGTAYNRHQLGRVRPGDVLLFGSGPENTSTSKHIGIVEKVNGNQVTLIEGNSGPNTDQVVRRTHTLSSSTFYGGVHPT